MAQLEGAFVEFAGRAERVLAGADDAGARRIADQLGGRVWRFGASGADLRLGNIRQSADGSEASLALPDGRTVILRLVVPGLHNLLNATAAIGVVLALGGELEPALEALSRYRGLGRRFERLGEVRGIAFVDDYAHHPSELVATLAAARQAFPGRRLIAVFQPHLYSRTAQHADAMGIALAAADLAIVTEIYGAREQPLPGVSGARVAEAARLAGASVVFEADRDGVRDRILERARSGDVVLTLGAGDITHVGRELVAWLQAA